MDTTIITLGAVILALVLIIIYLLIDRCLLKSLKKKIPDITEDQCEFMLNGSEYRLRIKEKVHIGDKITLMFTKRNYLLVTINEAVSGNINCLRGEIKVNGDVSGNVKSSSGDIIIDGNCNNANTESGDLIVNGMVLGEASGSTMINQPSL